MRRTEVTLDSTQIYLSDQWREIAAVVDRYEEAAGDQLPDVKQLLEGVSRRTAAPHCWNSCRSSRNIAGGGKQGKTVEEYLADYPDLARRQRRVPAARTFRVPARCGAGDRDFRKDFSRRFPELDLECDTLRDAASATPAALPTVARAVRRSGRSRSAAIGSNRGSAAGRTAWFIAAVTRSWTASSPSRSPAMRPARRGLPARGAERGRPAHPNIVRLLDYGKLDDGRPYIVYEYVAGRTLAERIAARDYTLGEAIRWTIAPGRGPAGGAPAADLSPRRQAGEHPRRRRGGRRA